MELKYVIYEVKGPDSTRTEAILFARGVMHSEAYLGARSSYFAERNKEVTVLSAGFCTLDGDAITAWGESTSLNVKSAEGDSAFLTQFLKEGPQWKQ